MVKRIIKYFFSILFTPIYMLISFIPQKKGLILFGAWNGKIYSDNPKNIFEYGLAKDEIKYKLYWVTESFDIYENLTKNKKPALLKGTFKCAYFQLIADAIVFTHSTDWEFSSYFIRKKTKRIQTWHGVPLKRIGKDDHRVKENQVIRTLKKILLPYFEERIDLALACGPEDAARYQTAFGIDSKLIKITGYARNDALNRLAKDSNEAKIKKVIYMPTFRGDPYEECSLTSDYSLDITRLDQRLRAIDVQLDIKLHPVKPLCTTDKNTINECTNINLIDNTHNLYDTLAVYDALITDFSGVYVDYMITGRPIILFALDLEGYNRKDRKLYYDINDISVTTPCYTWEDVLIKLDGLKNDRTNEEKIRYAKVKKMFHKHNDFSSSSRAWCEIKNLINGN